jgi:thioredoxin reductase
MIDVFNATPWLQAKIQQAANERSLLQLVVKHIRSYEFSTKVDIEEIDIAFAATGGMTHWVNSDNLKIKCDPIPNRQTTFGDILIEQPQGYVNLATPAGFIPLVDIVYSLGQLSLKQIN